ncbi:hypothetical protein BH11PSE11_BH11PSE11_29200 [soil metagenome]
MELVLEHFSTASAGRPGIAPGPLLYCGTSSILGQSSFEPRISSEHQDAAAHYEDSAL